MFATFFISAIFHELIFSAAFKVCRPFFFLGMILQLPLMWLGRFFVSKRRGNMLVWTSLFVGQVCLEILYVREFLETHDSFFCVD